MQGVKRLIDILFAACGLLLLWPLMLLVAVGGLFSMGRPVLFRQQRPGYKGRPFMVVKFRTMSLARDAQGALLPEGERLTAYGAFLRRFSLDELPQLWNVLTGEMSLVGPRPLLMQYLGHYTHEQARRHDVHPGITGWAQVNGRNDLTWDEKFALDLWYVDHWSLGLDLRIILRTLGRVLKREGISPAGEAVMPEFMGTRQPKPGASQQNP